MSELFVKIAIIASTAGFAAMLSLLPKGFSGTISFLYDTLPIILKGVYDLRIDKDARRLAAIAIVAGGYGGDMPEEQCYNLLDDMDFYYNKVKCKKIERMLPELSKMVIAESIHLS